MKNVFSPKISRLYKIPFCLFIFIFHCYLQYKTIAVLWKVKCVRLSKNSFVLVQSMSMFNQKKISIKGKSRIETSPYSQYLNKPENFPLAQFEVKADYRGIAEQPYWMAGQWKLFAWERTFVPVGKRILFLAKPLFRTKTWVHCAHTPVFNRWKLFEWW